MVGANPADGWPRAGFWRRALGGFIDVLLVAGVFELAVLILFPLTGGAVQMDIGVALMSCEPVLTAPKLPEPAPAQPGGLMVHCRTSLGPLLAANVLRVVWLDATREPPVFKSQNYRMNASDAVVAGVAIDPLMEAAHFAYLVASMALFGRTLGQRALRTHIVDVKTGDRPSWLRVALRYILLCIGLAPSLAVALFKPGSGNDVIDFASLGVPLGFKIILAAELCAALWAIVNIVLVAMKRDPFYDRWAGVAVLRDL